MHVHTSLHLSKQVIRENVSQLPGKRATATALSAPCTRKRVRSCVGMSDGGSHHGPDSSPQHSPLGCESPLSPSSLPHLGCAYLAVLSLPFTPLIPSRPLPRASRSLSVQNSSAAVDEGREWKIRFVCLDLRAFMCNVRQHASSKDAKWQ